MLIIGIEVSRVAVLLQVTIYYRSSRYLVQLWFDLHNTWPLQTIKLRNIAFDTSKSRSTRKIIVHTKQVRNGKIPVRLSTLEILAGYVPVILVRTNYESLSWKVLLPLLDTDIAYVCIDLFVLTYYTYVLMVR
jgi:hypothetical protein